MINQRRGKKNPLLKKKKKTGTSLGKTVFSWRGAKKLTSRGAQKEDVPRSGGKKQKKRANRKK